jgi:hypothetical protein
MLTNLTQCHSGFKDNDFYFEYTTLDTLYIGFTMFCNSEIVVRIVHSSINNSKTCIFTTGHPHLTGVSILSCESHQVSAFLKHRNVTLLTYIFRDVSYLHVNMVFSERDSLSVSPMLKVLHPNWRNARLCNETT